MDNSPTRGSATVRIDAPAEVAFAHLTDLTKLPELSPENARCEFQRGCETTLANLKAALEGR